MESATTEVLHLLNLAEELPEEDVGADLPPCLDGDVLHGQIIRAHFEQFQEEALVYSPHFVLTASKLTLRNNEPSQYWFWSP